MKQEVAKISADTLGVLTVSTGIGVSIASYLELNALAIGAGCALVSVALHFTMTIISHIKSVKSDENAARIDLLDKTQQKNMDNVVAQLEAIKDKM